MPMKSEDHVKKTLNSADAELRDRAFAYLLGRPRRWWQRCPQAVKDTVADVLALDDDLKNAVRRFLSGENHSFAGLSCAGLTVDDLLEKGAFTPISAVLWVQWFRTDPAHAASALLHTDEIVDGSENDSDSSTDERQEEV